MARDGRVAARDLRIGVQAEHLGRVDERQHGDLARVYVTVRAGRRDLIVGGGTAEEVERLE